MFGQLSFIGIFSVCHGFTGVRYLVLKLLAVAPICKIV